MSFGQILQLYNTFLFKYFIYMQLQSELGGSQVAAQKVNEAPAVGSLVLRLGELR